MSRFDSSDEIRRFLLSGGKASSESICQELGISRTTYYRTIDKIVQVFAERESEMHGRASEHADLVIMKELISQHPTWGCPRLAESLSSSFQMSPPTLQKILIKVGLGSRRERIQYLLNRVIAREVTELSEEQEQALAEINPCVVDIPLLDDESCLVVEAVVIPIPISSDWGKDLVLMLFVELSSSLVFGIYAYRTRNFANISIMQRSVEKNLLVLADMTNKSSCKLYWYSSVKIINIFGFNPICPRPKSEISLHRRTKKTLGGASVVNKRICNDFFDVMVKIADGMTLDELKRATFDWMLSNNVASAGACYPHEGRSPVQVLGLAENQIRNLLQDCLLK